MRVPRHYIWAAVLLLILVAFLFLLIKPLIVARIDRNLSAVVASRVIELVNRERAVENLKPLATSSTLAAAAKLKAEDMASREYFSHTTPEGLSPWVWLDQAGYKYKSAGENLAINFDQSELVTQAWMNSPTHRANIMRPEFAEIGIGLARGSYKGGPAVFIVQYFGVPEVEQSR